MSSTIAGTDSGAFSALITIPSDGDALDAGSVNAALGGLADRSVYLFNHLPGAASFPKVPLSPVNPDPAEWESWADGSLGIGWRQSAVTGSYLLFPLTFVQRGRLTAIELRVNAQSGRAGVPANQPSLHFITANAGVSPGFSIVDTETLAAGSLGAYETRHTIQLTGLSFTFGASDTVSAWCAVEGESGANALADKLFIEQITLSVDPDIV